MTNSFEELEKKYRQLIVKRIFFSSVAFMVVSLVFLTIFETANNQKTETLDDVVVVIDDTDSIKKSLSPKEVNDEDLMIVEELADNKKFSQKPKDIVRSYEINKSGVDNLSVMKLKPNINLDDIEDIAFRREKERARRDEKKFVNKKRSDIPEPKKVAIVEPIEKEEIKKVAIKFGIKEIKDDNGLKKQFVRNPTYKTAIKLARSYIAKSDHNNAVEWSLKAGRIDKKRVEPWIIYSKSKYQLGQKDLAIKVLKTLKENYDSKELNELLIDYTKKSM